LTRIHIGTGNSWPHPGPSQGPAAEMGAGNLMFFMAMFRNVMSVTQRRTDFRYIT
jgi:hypothetical protein